METTTILLCMCVAFLLLVILLQYSRICFLRKVYSKLFETGTAYQGQIQLVMRHIWNSNMFPGCLQEYQDIINGKSVHNMTDQLDNGTNIPNVALMLDKGIERSLKQSFERGRKQGREQGLKQGLEQGIAQGRLLTQAKTMQDFLLC